MTLSTNVVSNLTSENLINGQNNEANEDNKDLTFNSHPVSLSIMTRKKMNGIIQQ